LEREGFGSIIGGETPSERGTHAGERNPQGQGNALFTIAPEGKLPTPFGHGAAQHGLASCDDKGRMVGMLTFKEV